MNKFSFIISSTFVMAGTLSLLLFFLNHLQLSKTHKSSLDIVLKSMTEFQQNRLLHFSLLPFHLLLFFAWHNKNYEIIISLKTLLKNHINRLIITPTFLLKYQFSCITFKYHDSLKRNFSPSVLGG